MVSEIRLYLLLCLCALITAQIASNRFSDPQDKIKEDGINRQVVYDGEHFRDDSRIKTGNVRRIHLHDTLLRARRLNQVATQSLTAKQIRTEDSLKHELTKLKRRPHWTRCDSCNDTFKLQPVTVPTKNVIRYADTVRALGSKVNKLEKWKAASEDRIEKLENIIQQLRSEYSGNVKQDQRRGITKRATNSRPAKANTAGKASTSNESEIARLSHAVVKLNKTVHNRGKVIYRLFRRLGKAEKYTIRRFGVLELKAKQAQERADIALRSQRLQNGKFASVEKNITNRRRKLDALQTDILRLGTVISQVSKTTTEIFGKRLDALNATTVAKVEELETEIDETSETVSSLSILLAEQMDLSDSAVLDLADLQRAQESQGTAIAKNISKISKRLSEGEESLGQAMETIQELAEEVARQKIVTEKFEESMNTTMTTVKDQQIKYDDFESQTMKTIFDRFAGNVTELQATSIVLKNRLTNLHSMVTISRGMIINTENSLQSLDTRMGDHDEILGNMVQTCREEVEISSEKVNEAVSRINGTFEKLQGHLFSEIYNIKQRITAKERLRNIEIIALTNRTDTALTKVTEIQGHIFDSQVLVSNRFDAVHRNLSKILEAQQVSKKQRRNEITNLANELWDLNSTLTESFNASFEGFQAKLTRIRKKLHSFDKILQEQSEELRRTGAKSNRTTALALSSELELKGVKSLTETLNSNLQQMKEAQILESEQFDTKIETARKRTTQNLMGIEQRVSKLEMSNTSLNRHVQYCIDEVDAIKGGMKSLRKAENAVLTALSSYKSTISQQDQAQQNLTEISEKVRKTLQGHGLALQSIRDIMGKLNQSLVESQTPSYRSYGEQVVSQSEDINAMRTLMQNFSSLLSEVLNDQLSHGVLHATISARQRLIIEKLESYHVLIKVEKLATEENTESLENVKLSLNANARKLQKALDDLKTFSEEISLTRQNVIELKELVWKVNFTQFESTKEIKSWLSTARGEMSNISTKMTSMEEGEISRIQNQKVEVENILQDVGLLKKITTDFENNVSQVKLQQEVTAMNLSTLFELEVTTSGRLSALNSSTRLEMRSLVESINQTQTSREESAKLSDKRISELWTQVNALQQNDSIERQRLEQTTEIVERIAQESQEAAASLSEIRQIEIQKLIRTINSHKKRLGSLDTEIQGHALSIQSIHANSSGISKTVETMNTTLLHQNNRMRNFILRFEDLEKNENKKVTYQLQGIFDTFQRNISAVEELLSQVTINVDLNYNSTLLIFERLSNHDDNMTAINGESLALVSSLTSSLASLDYSLQDVNSSLHHNVNDLNELLSDFQAAFDTSNRELARYVDELNIMRTNDSNQFSHFSTSVEYLTQIVRETNKAVDENRDRMDSMNETVLFLRLSIPSALTPGIDENFFGTTNATYGENSLSGGEEFVTRSLRGKTGFRSSGSPRRIGDGESVPEREDNINADLTGQADERRAQGRLSDWSEEENGEIDNEYYLDSYNYQSRERTRRVTRDVKRIDREVSKMHSVIESLQSSVYHIGNESENHRSLLEQPPVVAFSAGLSTDYICCGAVIFDKVFINSGDGYDSRTGKFTASTSGTYVFFVTVAERNSFVRAALVENGMSRITVQMDHSSGDYEQSQSSNFVILPLTMDDQIWLQVYTGTLQRHQSPTVTFSGFLISSHN